MTAKSDAWHELAQQLRVDSVRAAAAAGSGHPTSSMSAAELAAVLLSDHLRYDFDDPENPANDHFVLSKGHASPLLYSMFKAAGAITDDELLTFRKFGSRLQGHPTPEIPWVDVATGSLGQGLPYGVGIALAGQRLDRLPYRIWVLCGDSEMAEGSMWEAFEHAAFFELDNLTAIIDVNRLGQRGETMHGWDLDSYANRAKAYGWHAIEIDGHDVEAIDRAYSEMYIAEQQLVATAVGLQVRNWVPFASTFAAFFSRAYDFIRMAAISQANIRLCGSHAGVSIGEDGPSQMALEDLAMMRAVHGSTVLYPSDGNQTAKLVVAMADRKGIVYMRTTRANTPALYTADDAFPIGGSKVVRGGGSDDRVAVIAAGITLHEAVKAADDLAKGGLRVRVIDAYSVKPIDGETLAAAAKATGGRIVVVEDHWPEGGIGDAVLAALADRGVRDLRYRHLAVRKMPGSGKPAELLADVGIDATAIAKAVRELAA